VTARQHPDTNPALDEAVDDYIAVHRPRAARELRYFKLLRSDEDAVTQAALCKLPSGKRHPHQRRIPRESLERSRDRLTENLAALREVETFDELLDLINALIRPIPKIGELTVYDIALRIGARFGLEPEKVYVHAGTREGARQLGFGGDLHAIEMVELPSPIRRLSAREAEDLLCIYKSKLR
jgi:hypothetical protein